MASLEAKLEAALTEVKNLSEALKKEVEERRRDHDDLIKFGEKIKTAYNRIECIEEVLQETSDIPHRVETVENELKEIKKDLKQEKKEEKEDKKDRRRINWGLVGTIVASILGAIAGAVIVLMFGG